MFVLLMLACSGGDDPGTATADTGTPTVTASGVPADYTADWAGVQAMFEDHCDVCHPSQNGIDLRTDIDAYVVAGSPEDSSLWEALQAQSISTMMPPSGKLSDEELAHVEAWILAGAPR